MWARVRLRRQLTKLVDGGGQQRVLGPHRAVRLTGRVRRTVIVHGRHAALHSGQVVKMAIFCERQQFIREFGWRVLFIGLLSLVPIAILGRAVHDDEERLPWSCLIMDRGVPPERGLVGECPPARIAHEWLLPRVDPMVALERVELRELLATLVTTVGPLPCVNFDMLVKRIPLSKSPETNFTFKGFGPSVDPVVMF